MIASMWCQWRWACSCGRDDLGIGRPEPAPADGLERSARTGSPRLATASWIAPPIDAGIDQGRHRHVAGDAAEAIEIADSHALTPYHEYGNDRRSHILSDPHHGARPEWGLSRW